eukprot:GHVU01177169.1.p1 GENE.GHVU01177169.1~~GHVU01177169.1.p1  ORF type:complete len:496 (-),score=72.00 GHVU01177169.1:974-2461(-)
MSVACALCPLSSFRNSFLPQFSGCEAVVPPLGPGTPKPGPTEHVTPDGSANSQVTKGGTRRRRTQLSEEAIRSATGADLTEEGGEVFLKGVAIESLGYESCRVACNKYGCKGYSNLGVKEMREAIRDHKRKQGSSEEAYAKDAAFLLMEERMCLDADGDNDNDMGAGVSVGRVHSTGKGQQPKLTTNSIFRCLNVFFHDSLVEKLSTMGDLATKDQLDRHHAGSPHPFFLDAAVLYNDDTALELNHVQHEHRMLLQAHLDPGNYEKADAVALKGVWRRVTKVYKEALDNSRKSGSHVTDFACFVKGRLDVLYMHLFLAARPNVANMVHAQLPADASVESSGLADHLARSAAAAAANAEAARASAAERGGGKRKGEMSLANGVHEAVKALKADQPDKETEGKKLQILEAKLSLEQERWAVEMRAGKVAEQQQQLQLYANAVNLLETQQRKLAAADTDDAKSVITISVAKLAEYCDNIMQSLLGAQGSVGGRGAVAE